MLHHLLPRCRGGGGLAIEVVGGDELRLVLAVRDRRVFRRVAASWHVGRQASCAVEVRAEEERDRVPVGARDVQHAMRRRQPAVVGPAAQQVAGVDEEAAGQHRRVEPRAVGAADLQAADAVLHQEREEAGVGVRAGAVLLRLALVAHRIVEEAQLQVRRIEVRGEEVERQVERARDDRQHLHAERLDRRHVRERVLAEAGQIARPLVEAAERLARQDVRIVRACGRACRRTTRCSSACAPSRPSSVPGCSG